MIFDIILVVIAFAFVLFGPGPRWLDLPFMFAAGFLTMSALVRYSSRVREQLHVHQITRDVLPPMNQTLGEIRKRAARKRG